MGNVYQIDYKPPAWLAYVTLTWGPDFPTVQARQYFLVAHGHIPTMTDLDTECFC